MAYMEQTPVVSAVRTASGGTGTLTGFGSAASIRAQLDVTAVSGSSPTLDVVLEETFDGTNWSTVKTFAQMTAPGRGIVSTSDFTNRLRIRWTITGTTPSFTFSVTWALR